MHDTSFAGSAVPSVLAFASDAKHFLTPQDIAGCGLEAIMERHGIPKEYPFRYTCFGFDVKLNAGLTIWTACSFS